MKISGITSTASTLPMVSGLSITVPLMIPAQEKNAEPGLKKPGIKSWFKVPHPALSHPLPGGEGKRASAGYAALFRNRSFVCNTLSMAAMTFAIGGLAQWIPSFLYRVHSLDVAKGNTLFGATTVLAGILGTLAGGLLGDRWQKRSGKGYLLISGWGFLIGTPFAA